MKIAFSPFSIGVAVLAAAAVALGAQTTQGIAKKPKDAVCESQSPANSHTQMTSYAVVGPKIICPNATPDTVVAAFDRAEGVAEAVGRRRCERGGCPPNQNCRSANVAFLPHTSTEGSEDLGADGTNCFIKVTVTLNGICQCE